MANGKESDNRTVPYLPYSTFKNYLGRFTVDSVPPRIDRSVMAQMSGADQSAVRTALRFFGMVDPEQNDAVTERFRQMVSVQSTDHWGSTLSPVVEVAYRDIVKGLDKTATPQQLEECFRDRAGVQGSVLDKAIRFYLSIAEEAGIELSPLFKKRSAPTRRGGSRRRSARDDSGNANQIDTPRGKKTLVYSFPSGDVQVVIPENMTKKEVAKLGTYISDYHDMMEDND